MIIAESAIIVQKNYIVRHGDFQTVPWSFYEHGT